MGYSNIGAPAGGQMPVYGAPSGVMPQPQMQPQPWSNGGGTAQYRAPAGVMPQPQMQPHPWSNGGGTAQYRAPTGVMSQPQMQPQQWSNGGGTAQYGAPAGVIGGYAYNPPMKPKRAFAPDKRDFIFALAAFILGYLFSCWVFFTGKGWGVTAFTTVYLLSVAAYLDKKGAFIKSGETWFWMAITWIAGASFTLWDNAGIGTIRMLFLFCAAVYYVIIASGRAFMGKTGNYLVIDGLNAFIIVPFRNFVNQYISFSTRKVYRKKHKKALPIILGALFALFLVICLVPLLLRADSGGFKEILSFLADIFTIRPRLIFKFAVFALYAGPVAAYIYGLVSGAAHKQGADVIKPDSVKNVVATLRSIHPATIFIVLGTVCGLYMVFILSQITYFFSAFIGERPDGWLIYSEYARRGFFELCGIAAINLFIITIGNVTCRKQRKESRPLKAFNIILAIITLVLITTAISKMALYIDAYGLTMQRLLPCVFMVFMAVVFIALIALQKTDFSIVRFALITGSVMLCTLFLSNPDALVVRYNTDRYLSGTLAEYDTGILYRSGYAGVQPAIEVYEKTSSDRLRNDITRYLDQLPRYQDWSDEINRGVHEYSIEALQAIVQIRNMEYGIRNDGYEIDNFAP